MVICFKKGNRKDIKNYRQICLLSNMYKLFTKIITTRLEKKLDENQHREQAGFRSKYCITLYFRGKKISRKVNLKYFREKLFSRIYCSRENIFPRKYLLAKISSRENIIPRKSFACYVSVASFSLFAAR